MHWRKGGMGECVIDQGLKERTTEQVDAFISSWLYDSPWPIAVTDGDLALLWCNKVAQAEIDEAKSFLLVEGRLTLGTDELDSELRAFLEECGHEDRLFARKITGKEEILARCRIISRSDDDCIAGISFFRPNARPPLRHPSFGRLFGLTNAEERVLLMLLDGASADSISSLLGTSLATVRKHVSNIYAKLKVRSREGLFARLRLYY